MKNKNVGEEMKHLKQPPLSNRKSLKIDSIIKSLSMDELVVFNAARLFIYVLQKRLRNEEAVKNT